MQRNFRITVDGRGYHVVVEDLDASAAPAFVRAAPVVVAAPPSAVAVATIPPSPAVVSPAAVGGDAIVAPLGGVVVSIDVPLGHTVAVGDKVATIEAMKMKIEVMSKLAGKVAHIAAKVNESVATGQLLMTIG